MPRKPSGIRLLTCPICHREVRRHMARKSELADKLPRHADLGPKGQCSGEGKRALAVKNIHREPIG